MIVFQYLPSATLFAMMLAMGMELSLADFRRVASEPRAALVGMVGQLLVLPGVALAIAWVLALPPALAVGLLLIAACPGGTTSNALSYLARGDVALSISLTAISSSIAFVWVPVVFGVALPLLGVRGPGVSLSFAETMTPVLATTAAPLALGMWLGHARPALCRRIQQPLLRASITVLLLLIVGLPIRLAAQSVDVLGIFARATLPVVLLIGATTGVALAASRAFRLGRSRSITIAIEVGLQNFALAMVLALTVFERPEFLAAGIVYLPVMLLFSAALVAMGRRGESGPLVVDPART